MTIATTHLPAAMTIPVAFALACGLVWYWIRVGRGEVSRGRRLVRRVSIVMLFLSLPNFVRGLSFLDPSIDRAEYVVTWSVSILVMLGVFFVAWLDGAMTMREHRRRAERELIETHLQVTTRGKKEYAEDGS